jgi:LmbE family N-acetylglucosaminyl deacetylase
MNTFTIACILCLLSITHIYAQRTNYTPGDIAQLFEKIKNPNTVLYIAAHPDDENTRLLSWFANTKNYRTAYLSLTRGDGGQNLVGNEQGIPLGIIRTQELLAARRIDGAEQYFTRAYDFGFSKTSDESLQFWNKEEILSDVVWVIRNLKPDIIISRFPKDKRAGHGHHASAGILAEEAFYAAADAKRFPEQLKWVQPWQAKRVLWNSFNFGTTNTTTESQFKIVTGDYVQNIGKSIGELAAESRSMHKSQGFGVPMQRGNITEYFENWGGDAPQNTLMDGVQTSWKDVVGGEDVEAAINNIIKTFDYKNPTASTLALTVLYKLINGIPDTFSAKQYKLNLVNKAIQACTGLYIEALSNQAYIAYNDSCRITIGMINRSNAQISFVKATALENNIDIATDKNLMNNNNVLAHNIWYTDKALVQLNTNTPVSNPYWLQYGLVHNRFNIKNQAQIGMPEDRRKYQAQFTFNIHGTNINIEVPILYKLIDPVKGELLQPIQVVERSSVIPSNNVVLTKQASVAVVNYMVKHFYKGKAAMYNIKTTDQKIDVQPGTTQNFSTPITSNASTSALSYTNVDGVYNKQMHEIHYDHIPTQVYYDSADVKLVHTKINITKKKLGYIIGAGDKLMQGLEQMGYNVTVIEKHQMNIAYLKQFDAIITGIRAYNTNDWLNSSYETLMDYIKQGGNLIVQYNTNSGVGPLKINIGPYPFTIGRTRVTEEDAAVTMNTPKHIVFNAPNKIDANDFKGWVQERSIYHAEKFDSTTYITPITMNDVTEKPDNGSLLITPYGKGNFVYTGIVFFRQIPAGVAGAYKLLANLIQLPKNK